MRWAEGLVAGLMSLSYHWKPWLQNMNDSGSIFSNTRSHRWFQEASTALDFHIGLQCPPIRAILSASVSPSPTLSLLLSSLSAPSFPTKFILLPLPWEIPISSKDASLLFSLSRSGDHSMTVFHLLANIHL